MASKSRKDAEPGYQDNEVDSRKVWAMAGVLLLSVLLCCAVIAWMLQGLEARHAAFQPPLSTLERERMLPPEPRLESRPKVDGIRYRQQAQQQLDGYGWVDRPQGIAHIPLKQAQQELLKRGWPEHYAGRSDEHHAH